MKTNEQAFVELFNKSPQRVINKLDKYVADGYIKSNVNSFFPELTIYNYSEKTTFERKWNTYTLACRGLVIDKKELRIVAMPFSKFFNLDELKNTDYEHLSCVEPTQTYETYIKMDGSLGIGFVHKNTFIWCTRGSFDSEQARFANFYMRENFTEEALENLAFDYEGMTILAEIIYPNNRIVVDYGETKGLIILGMIRNSNGIEMNYRDLCLEGFMCNLPVVDKYEGNTNIKELLKSAKEWDKNMEGVVIKYANGKRLKLKGAEYLRVHKLRYGFSMKQQVELWKDQIHENYLAEIDEEFRDELDVLYKTLDVVFNSYVLEVMRMVNDVEVLKLDRSDIYKHFESKGKNKTLIACVFSVLDNKGYKQKIREYMYKEYRSILNVKELEDE
jgi:RNA ligase